MLLAVFTVHGVQAQQETPSVGLAAQNVVLIIADDMRHDSWWAMPALNRLASGGVTFDRFYVTTPLCCPSRASILTGLYARHHGVLSNDPPQGGAERFDDRSTVATWLQSAGVRTGLIGRYLNGYQSPYVPPGWEFWFAMWQSGGEYGNYYRYRVTDNGSQRYFGSSSREYSTTVLGQQAVKFLSQEPTRPFLLMLTPRTPHGPATPDREDSGVFKERELPLLPSYDEEDVDDKPSWVRGADRLSGAEHEALDGFRRRQLESLLSLDRLIDSIAQTLRADGRLERTWIIFTADNGLTLGEHRLTDSKKCAYEECIRVPLVVVPPPGVAVPRNDDHLVANIDLAPTVAAILGADVGGPVDGRSLLPLLANPSTPWREGVVIEQWSDSGDPSWIAVRTADRKYVRYPNGEEELYDGRADPYELHNLGSDPSHAAEKAELARLLEALLAD